MDIGYAIDVSSKEDPHIVTAEKALTGLNIASLHGAFLVESIPLLKYVPSWIPWAGFQNKAKEWKHYTDKMIKDPFAVVKKRMVCATMCYPLKPGATYHRGYMNLGQWNLPTLFHFASS